MNPRFAKAVDPIFMQVIRLLERVEQGEQPDLQEERTAIINRVTRAEAQLGMSEDWQFAKYAIAAWVDEVMIFAQWSDWENHQLEFEFFNSANAHTEFYAQAQQAWSLTNKDALEVFYVCVVLGFRGVYREDTGAGGGGTLRHLGLPSTLKSWARQMRGALQLRQGRPPITIKPVAGESSRPLKGKFQFLASGLSTLILSAALVTVGWSYLAAKVAVPRQPAAKAQQK